MSFLSSKHLGSACAAISGLMYGFIGYFGMTLMRADFSIANMLFWRFLTATLFVGLLLLPKLKTRHKNKREHRREIAKVFFSGTIFYTACSVFYFIGSEHLGTGLCMVVFFIYPALTILFNWLLYRTGIPRTYYLAVAMILMGMPLLVDLGGASLNFKGLGISVLASAFYAAYIVSSKKSTLTPLTSTFTLSLGCMLASYILALIDQSFVVPDNRELWFNVIGLGILCTALPILLFLKALHYISGEQAAILSVLEPLFVVIFGALLLDEPLNGFNLIGIAIILSGALITIVTTQQQGEPERSALT